MYGPGDRWFVPAIGELLQRVPALPENGRARLSLVAVDDLARLPATLARTPEHIPPGTVHHAAHPHAPTLREFVTLLGETHGLPVPQDGLALHDHLTRLHTTPGRVSAHQAGLLAEDRWHRSPLVPHRLHTRTPDPDTGPGSARQPRGTGRRWHRRRRPPVTPQPYVFHVKHSRGAEDPQVSRPTP
ncbi:hypothetical protein [Streptomyces sp. TLI_185]|uniref:hypothetical protein n=1 Tax=Streptomyces sp. TLI_185 TaxID=2485151 RepID=UPI000F4E63C5|nr:hypothetical protein [Streptomyces sp. TLI_185]